MTFPYFVAADPDLGLYARTMFLRIDAEAGRLGASIVANTTSDDLRRRGGSPWIMSFNATMASALERDPSGRLAAVPALRAWAALPDGVGNTWINWWVALYEKYLDARLLKQPITAAAK